MTEHKLFDAGSLDRDLNDFNHLPTDLDAPARKLDGLHYPIAGRLNDIARDLDHGAGRLYGLPGELNNRTSTQ